MHLFHLCLKNGLFKKQPPPFSSGMVHIFQHGAEKKAMAPFLQLVRWYLVIWVLSCERHKSCVTPIPPRTSKMGPV